VQKLNKELNAAFVDPRTKARIAEVDGTPLPGSPRDFGRFIAKEVEKWDTGIWKNRVAKNRVLM
jgi:hypothetical protein